MVCKVLAPGPPGLAGLFLALLWMTWTEVGIVPLTGYVRPTHGQKASLSGPGGSGSIRQWSWVGSLLEEGHAPSLPGGSDVGRSEAPCHGCVMRARGSPFQGMEPECPGLLKAASFCGQPFPWLCGWAIEAAF